MTKLSALLISVEIHNSIYDYIQGILVFKYGYKIKNHSNYLIRHFNEFEMSFNKKILSVQVKL